MSMSQGMAPILLVAAFTTELVIGHSRLSAVTVLCRLVQLGLFGIGGLRVVKRLTPESPSVRAITNHPNPNIAAALEAGFYLFGWVDPALSFMVLMTTFPLPFLGYIVSDLTIVVGLAIVAFYVEPLRHTPSGAATEMAVRESLDQQLDRWGALLNAALAPATTDFERAYALIGFLVGIVMCEVNARNVERRLLAMAKLQRSANRFLAEQYIRSTTKPPTVPNACIDSECHAYQKFIRVAESVARGQLQPFDSPDTFLGVKVRYGFRVTPVEDVPDACCTGHTGNISFDIRPPTRRSSQGGQVILYAILDGPWLLASNARTIELRHPQSHGYCLPLSVLLLGGSGPVVFNVDCRAVGSAHDINNRLRSASAGSTH